LYGKGAVFGFLIDQTQGKNLVLNLDEGYQFSFDQICPYSFYLSTSIVGGTRDDEFLPLNDHSGLSGDCNQDLFVFEPSSYTNQTTTIYYGSPDGTYMGGQIDIVTDGSGVKSGKTGGAGRVSSVLLVSLVSFLVLVCAFGV